MPQHNLLSERVRGLNRRARSYTNNGVKFHEPNSAERADALEAAADNLRIRSARAQVVQYAMRRAMRGTDLKEMLLRIAHGSMPRRTDLLAAKMVSPTGVWSPVAPAVQRVLNEGTAPTEDDIAALRAIAKRTIPTERLKAWLIT